MPKLFIFTVIFQMFTTTTATPLIGNPYCDKLADKAVALIYNQKGICAGVVVHRVWILFGTSCMEKRLGFDTQRTQIRTIYEPPETRKVNKIVPCPSANCSFGLIRMDRPLRTPVLSLVQLPKPYQQIPHEPNATFSPISYVYVKFQRPWTKNSLKMQCDQVIIKDRCWIHGFICAAMDPVRGNLVDVCDVRNHTGGALVCNGVVFGFLDWTTCEAGKNRLGFADVAKHMDFVEKTMKSGALLVGRGAVKYSMAANKVHGMNASKIYNCIFGTLAVIVALVVSKFLVS